MFCAFVESLVHHFNNALMYIDKDIIDVCKCKYNFKFHLLKKRKICEVSKLVTIVTYKKIKVQISWKLRASITCTCINNFQ
jgi:hypothetical protein